MKIIKLAIVCYSSSPRRSFKAIHKTRDSILGGINRHADMHARLKKKKSNCDKAK